MIFETANNIVREANGFCPLLENSLAISKLMASKARVRRVERKRSVKLACNRTHVITNHACSSQKLASLLHLYSTCIKGFFWLDPVMHFIRNQTELHTPTHFANDMNVHRQWHDISVKNQTSFKRHRKHDPISCCRQSIAKIMTSNCIRRCLN